ncbi:uncharacterized protein LOC8258046 [Ricinus communis]|uniref:Uncharacterized protein n=1 Tax=Ricinus communis TaxID=3988 RepID=B9RWW3_RICCO|nr:uncharacterized protein LOC8258046 [Ricinus communis]EEF44118.1 conserved hypothetical protein [Ricinus communis]|eukprot:XP_002518232.1 uncharacterized protein LOC8258046 [Ricinus communis]
MGSCLSCRSSPKLKSIRVVHLNGYVEYFEYPVLVSQITDKSCKHFVSTAAQLLSTASKSLKPDAQLQQGQIYFLLPYSTLQAEVSPLDFAALVKRLTSVAKKSDHCRKANNTKSSRTVPTSTSPIISPGRFVQPVQPSGMAFRGKRCSVEKPWKPILDTIREKSFNRRSESDVIQEMQLEMTN